MIVSFAIVAYNEEKVLPRLLSDLAAQDYPKDKTEVLLIDSMSTDDTRLIMEKFAREHQDYLGVKVLSNFKKIIPCGQNVALDNYSGDALIRIDAHATMPYDFISKNVAVLQSGEVASGGRRPNIIDSSTPFKETLLTAEQSMFGSSIAPYRNSGKKMYTSSLFCGMYRREVYDKVGRYNELLPRSEDNDMTYRMRKAGFKLCYSPDIVFYQHTRNTLFKMLKQKFLNGYWIGKTMGVSPRCFSVFHFVPFAFVLGIILTTVLACLGHPFLSLLMWAAYGVLVVAMTVIELIKKPKLTNLLLPLIFLLLHLSYGVGTVLGFIVLPFWLHKIKNESR
ncbi:MAG: glycosyltransferase family 2 protein [Clostridia bacterium]|nr:glycosyltransferase family 2 protein [Clostridia bacterium]